MSNELLRRIGFSGQPGQGKESGGSQELISDDRIREILERYSPILHRGIAEANSFFMRSAGQKLVQAVPMTADELDNWQRYHQVIDKTLQTANKLFVPIIDVDEQTLIEPSEYEASNRSSNRQIALRGNSGRRYRVNLDEVIRVPIQPLEPRNLQFLVKPHAHLGGMGGSYGGGKNSLYNAFIGLDTFVLDEYDRWVLKAIPGTTPGVDGPSWGEGPVYSPYMPARSSIWFNTSVDERKPNALQVSGEGQFDMMFHCEIHHPDQIDQLSIPQNGRLRFFFWQLEAFIKNPSIGSGRSFPMLDSGL